MFVIAMGFGFGNFLAAMGDPVNPAEENSEDGDEVGNAGEHLVGVHGQRALGEIIAVAELLKVDGGEQHDRGAPDFGFTVNVVQVLVGVVLDALACLLQKLFALAELGGAGGTYLSAGGGLAGGDAWSTHDALADAGNGLVPFVLGNAKGASGHAVTASHALVLVVGDWAERGLFQRTDRTNRSAGRIVAVHAELAHELVVLGEDGSVLMGRGYILFCNFVIVRQAVFGGAGLFALLAADAHGGIVKNSHAHG